MASSKNSKKNPAAPTGRNNGMKKIREFRFNFDLKTIFVILFVGIFIYYAFSSLSKEVNRALPEKPLSTIIKDIKNKKIKISRPFWS